MPCQDLLITCHFTTGILNTVHSMPPKERKKKTKTKQKTNKRKISLAKFKETRYVTTAYCFRNHSPAGIRSLMFD